ncbi:MerR family transcriptional regulator [Massilia terrae]|uniref:MerR family transcriptional regulator n=1 Tax=Massilia terrae TaxID=1811224 RepID=A0ABT2CZ97_9BURK|nr:MerR family transcriptional regulator [Massilia terrae]MCS0659194.1 MerR family transcriptional regulator [Massilia terrae]
MKIGELAKRSGLSASAIRFYESKGLLKSGSRLSNGYREYPPEAAAILSIIINAQQTGFTLDEIRSILPADAAGWQHDQLIATLRKKIDDIESMERRLAENRTHIMSLIDLINSKPEGMECKDNTARVMDSVGRHANKKTD